MISDGFRLVPHVMQRKSVLSIFVLVQSDGGNYTCRAQSANTTETELSYQLTISLSPLPTSSPVFSPSPTPAGTSHECYDKSVHRMYPRYDRGWGGGEEL